MEVSMSNSDSALKSALNCAALGMTQHPQHSEKFQKNLQEIVIDNKVDFSAQNPSDISYGFYEIVRGLIKLYSRNTPLVFLFPGREMYTFTEVLDAYELYNSMFLSHTTDRK
jgi:hypothetical protein